MSSQTDACAFNGPMARLIKSGIHLDLFYYELNDDGTMVVDREMYLYDEHRTHHEYDDIFPLKKCMYGGVELTCPTNSLKFLDIVYGENVMVPKYKCSKIFSNKIVL